MGLYISNHSILQDSQMKMIRFAERSITGVLKYETWKVRLPGKLFVLLLFRFVVYSCHSH